MGMKRRRISQVGIAGILAVISAVGLIAIVSLSNGTLKQINPTEQQQTVDALVRVRVTQTAEMRATSQATAEATDVIDPIWQTATAVYLLSRTNSGSPATPGTPPTIDVRFEIVTETAAPTSTPENP